MINLIRELDLYEHACIIFAVFIFGCISWALGGDNSMLILGMALAYCVGVDCDRTLRHNRLTGIK